MTPYEGVVTSLYGGHDSLIRGRDSAGGGVDRGRQAVLRSLSLTHLHTHTHSHTLSLSLLHTHTHSLALSQVIGLIVANRLCFARREGMDFLLAIGTSELLAGRTGFFLKVPFAS